MSGAVPGAGWRAWLPRAALLALLAILVWYYGDLREPALCSGDEALTAVRARSLVEGSFWTPRWNGEVNLHKPPFYYWWVAAGFKVVGFDERAVRLPSVLAFLLLLVLTYRMVGRLAGTAWAGVLAAGLLAHYPTLVYQSRMGMMDTLVLLLFLVSGWALWRAAQRPRCYLVWGTACGCALLTKGGGAILGPVVGLVWLALARPRAFTDRTFWAAIVPLLVIPGSWFGYQYVAHHDALFNTYFAWEVGYRLQGYSKWEALLTQATTNRMWVSLGVLAPLAFGGLIRATLGTPAGGGLSREGGYLVWLAVLGLYLTNLVKQQMYWYVLPMGAALLLLAALLLADCMRGRLSVAWHVATGVLLLAGTFLPGSRLGPEWLWWMLRLAVLAATLLRWTPRPRWIAGALLGIALAGMVHWGLAFGNETVNLSRPKRDAMPIRELAARLPAEATSPLLVDFTKLSHNALLFYSGRTTVDVRALDAETVPAGAIRYAILEKTGKVAGFRAEPVTRVGNYALLRLERKQKDGEAADHTDDVTTQVPPEGNYERRETREN